MLELVLEDEPEDEPSVQERVLCVEIGVLECLEHTLADGARVGRTDSGRSVGSSGSGLRACRKALETSSCPLSSGGLPGQVPEGGGFEVRDLGELPHER